MLFTQTNFEAYHQISVGRKKKKSFWLYWNAYVFWRLSSIINTESTCQLSFSACSNRFSIHLQLFIVWTAYKSSGFPEVRWAGLWVEQRHSVGWKRYGVFFFPRSTSVKAAGNMSSNQKHICKLNCPDCGVTEKREFIFTLLSFRMLTFSK